jgi:low affinity Fe/Cu permease
MAMDQLDAILRKSGKAVLTFEDLNDLVGVDVDDAEAMEALYKWGEAQGIAVKVNPLTKTVVLG